MRKDGEKLGSRHNPYCPACRGGRGEAFKFFEDLCWVNQKETFRGLKGIISAEKQKEKGGGKTTFYQLGRAFKPGYSQRDKRES